MRNSTTAQLKLLASMTIFGTIGIFVRFIPLSSAVIALCRGLIGAVFLLLVTWITRKHISWVSVRKNILPLIVSGVFIGLNWVLLFESYRYTTVAAATLCYYMAPVFVVVASPFILKERLTVRKTVCVVVALCGMVCVSGLLQTGFTSLFELKGVLLSLGAALLYASVTLLNKKTQDIGAYDKTVVQLAAAGVIMIPYCLFTQSGASDTVSWIGILLLMIVCIVHTGFAYTLFFGAVTQLPAQTTAIYSYLDPIIAVVLSAVLLKEEFTLFTAIGAVCILGAAFVSELPTKSK